MNERIQIFWKELLEQCEINKRYEFIFKVEYWGILWMPWFIYVDNKSLEFSFNDISENDLNELIKLNLIEFIEEISPVDSIDIYAKKYKIKKL